MDIVKLLELKSSDRRDVSVAGNRANRKPSVDEPLYFSFFFNIMFQSYSSNFKGIFQHSNFEQLFISTFHIHKVQ